MSTSDEASSSPPPARQLAVKVAVFLGLLGLTAVACFLFRPTTAVSESGVIMRWPERALGMEGKEEPVSEAERNLLPPDTEFAKRTYGSSPNSLVAQIVLSGVERRSIHRPEACLPGQGWTVRGGHVEKVPLASGRSIDVMILDISRPVRRSNGTTVELPALYAYFFVSKDAETPHHFDRIAITNLDMLFHNRAHRWAYVIAMTQILEGLAPGGKDREQALQMIKDFFRETAPAFLKSERVATTPNT
jgi:hypothetical protein